ncbi:hypothetical protein SCLCIDRAFT_1213069 [Scleroderma citrinum Foug A]|uniref:Uncharacterized protein n=1 Tax=Scleroderma citrinum Foug A TaxID=1036808 RepID=A0A0C3E9C2_9AGAM|nr:hypothetical protein SCLCIDRAFT_1213069 [Scleroderma citrinum Foug A]
MNRPTTTSRSTPSLHAQRLLSAPSPPMSQNPTHSTEYDTTSKTPDLDCYFPYPPLHQHSHRHTSPQQPQPRTPHLVRQTRIIGFYTTDTRNDS